MPQSTTAAIECGFLERTVFAPFSLSLVRAAVHGRKAQPRQDELGLRLSGAIPIQPASKYCMHIMPHGHRGIVICIVFFINTAGHGTRWSLTCLLSV